MTKVAPNIKSVALGSRRTRTTPATVAASAARPCFPRKRFLATFNVIW